MPVVASVIWSIPCNYRDLCHPTFQGEFVSQPPVEIWSVFNSSNTQREDKMRGEGACTVNLNPVSTIKISNHTYPSRTANRAPIMPTSMHSQNNTWLKCDGLSVTAPSVWVTFYSYLQTHHSTCDWSVLFKRALSVPSVIFKFSNNADADCKQSLSVFWH